MRIVWLFVIPLVAGALAALAWRALYADRSGQAQSNMVSAGPTLERLRDLSVLMTLKADVADAVATELRGRTGGVQAVLIVRGEVIVGVDMRAAIFLLADPKTRHAVLRLPGPTVEVVRLDHDRTKLLGVWSDGLWAVTPGGRAADAAAVNAAYREAERTVAVAADDDALVSRARAQAEVVLRAFLDTMGWTVEIRWQKPR